VLRRFPRGENNTPRMEEEEEGAGLWTKDLSWGTTRHNREMNLFGFLEMTGASADVSGGIMSL